MMYILGTFFGIGILFGNLNALAMENLGHVAGMASAIIGMVTTVFSTMIGTMIGGFFTDNIYPLVLGFCIASSLTLVAIQFLRPSSQ